MSFAATTPMISANNARGSDLPSRAQSKVEYVPGAAPIKSKVSPSQVAGEWKPVLIVAAAGLLILLPIMIWGIPSGGDLANHYRFALPFYDSIRSGTLYPGWLAESNNGLGDPRFRFYPPALYYLLAVTRTISGGWYVGSIAAFTLISVVGGLGVYFWTRMFCPPKIAMLAGVLYTVAPYHLNEIYQASLLSEYAACSVLPFAFGFVERVCNRRNIRDVAGLSISYALLVLTNIPLAVIGSLSLFVYSLLRMQRRGMLSVLRRLAISVALGLSASAFFWTTMLVELPWIKGSSTDLKVYYDYRVNFLFSSVSLTNRNTWYANLLGLAVVGFSVSIVTLIKRSAPTDTGSAPKQELCRYGSAFRDNRGFLASGLLMLFSFFMATALSRPLWAVLPKLGEVQFPWRWLAITSMASAAVTAAGLLHWFEMVRVRLRPRDLVIPLCFVLALYFVAFEVIRDSDYVQRQEFETRIQDSRGAVSFKDWLPVWAHEMLQVAKMSSNVEAQQRTITITSWAPLHRTFDVGPGAPGDAHVRTYFYPHWIASASGKVLSTRPAEDGTILITIPPEAVSVNLDFREPRRTRIAAIVSTIGWTLISGIFIFGSVKKFHNPDNLPNL